VRQWIVGAAYDGRWMGLGSVSLGLQRTGYRKTVTRPGEPAARTDDQAWLPTATAALELSPKLALYGSYTRGLEESGIAPDSAANRTEVLPAILTSQIDAGLRWRVGANLNLVAGLFEVTKPYFAADARNVFTELGDVRHRGLEFSVAGTATPGLTLVAGAVLMRPRVTGEPVREGRIGRRALGQTGRTLTLATQYAVPGMDGLVLSFNATHRGDRVADTLNLVEVPSRTILDAGLRYTFNLGRTPALLRFTVFNLTNAYDWQIVGSGAYQVNTPRNAALFLTMDF
jgi:iron complex outermembrane recepter protein